MLYGEEFVVDNVYDAAHRILSKINHDREIIKEKSLGFDLSNTVDFYHKICA